MSTVERDFIAKGLASIVAVITSPVAEGEPMSTAEKHALVGALQMLGVSFLGDVNRIADAVELIADHLEPAQPQIVTASAPLPDDRSAPSFEQRAISDFVAWLTTRQVTTKIGAAYPAPAAFELVTEYMGVKYRGT